MTKIRTKEVGHGIPRIRNAESYANEQIDLDVFFGDVFEGSNIRASDVDGVVERYSRILLIERKGSREIGEGQRILFEAFSRNSKRQVVLVFIGAVDAPSEYCTFQDGVQSEWKATNRDDMLSRLRSWRNRAERKPL